MRRFILLVFFIMTLSAFFDGCGYDAHQDESLYTVRILNADVLSKEQEELAGAYFGALLNQRSYKGLSVGEKIRTHWPQYLADWKSDEQASEQFIQENNALWICTDNVVFRDESFALVLFRLESTDVEHLLLFRKQKAHQWMIERDIINPESNHDTPACIAELQTILADRFLPGQTMIQWVFSGVIHDFTTILVFSGPAELLYYPEVIRNESSKYLKIEYPVVDIEDHINDWYEKLDVFRHVSYTVYTPLFAGRVTYELSGDSEIDAYLEHLFDVIPETGFIAWGENGSVQVLWLQESIDEK